MMFNYFSMFQNKSKYQLKICFKRRMLSKFEKAITNAQLVNVH